MERSAEEARARALAAAGLKPLGADRALRAGDRIQRIPPPHAAGGDDMEPVDVVVAADAASGSVVVLVEELAASAPPRALPRDELATWAGGAADDFSDDWAWMAAEIPPAAPARVASSAGPRRRKRR